MTAWQSQGLTAAAVLLWAAWVASAAASEPTLAERAGEAARIRGAAGNPFVHRDGELRAGASTRTRVQLAPKQCVVVAAAAAQQVQDVTLSLRTGAGISMHDGHQSPDAYLRYCAGTEDEAVTVALTADAPGPFWLGVWGVRGQTRPTSLQVVEPEPEPEPAISAESRLHRAIEAHEGLQPAAPVGSGEARPGKPAHTQVVLGGGHCYLLAGAAGGDVEGLALRLKKTSGGAAVAVSSAKRGGSGKVAWIGKDTPLCVVESEPYQLEARVSAGSGPVAWQLLLEPGARPVQFAVGGKARSASATAMRQLVERTLADQAAVSPYLERRLQTGEQLESTLEVEGGDCYTVAATSVPSLRSIRLQLLDRRGAVLSEATAPGSSATVRACARLDGRWTIRAVAFEGYGRTGVQAFSE